MLDWFGHIDPPIELVPVGVKGGVDVEGFITDGEAGASGLIEPNSSPEPEYDLGEGNAEPVEAYKGRSSSGLCAKKQTLLLQLVSSLHRRVRYWAG